MQVVVTDSPPPAPPITRIKPEPPRRKEFWTVPEIWPGGTCYILGGGPSLAKVPMERLHDLRVIAVNNAYQLGDWIDVMFYGDCRWFNWHGKALLNFPGLKVTACDSHKDKPGIMAVKRQNSPLGITSQKNKLSWNLSSGACAINLAVHFGVKKIVLFGFDMRMVDDKNNWHEDHKDGPKKNPYERFLRPFPSIAKDLERFGIECINATPGSALDVFPIVEPEDVLP